jgi:Uma2 family endonuclease
MTLSVTPRKRPTPARPFKVGTTGWSVQDLNDPRIERRWEAGHYEIVEGVLTTMPPAHFDGSLALGRLQSMIAVHLHATGQRGDFSPEVDFIVSQIRVARVDLVFTTPEDQARQLEANKKGGKPKLRFGRLLVPPTLIVESVSPGHEVHDRDTKQRWYAEAGVKHYWILDGFQRRLDCLTLVGSEYGVDQAGRDSDELRPSVFPGLVIPLARLWP